MSTTTINRSEFLGALEEERTHLTKIAMSVAHSARELALVADIYSERIRQTPVFPERLRQIEGHLGHLRRDAADAQYMAETVRRHLGEDGLNWRITDTCDQILRDAQLRLTMADLAYDHACDLAG